MKKLASKLLMITVVFLTLSGKYMNIQLSPNHTYTLHVFLYAEIIHNKILKKLKDKYYHIGLNTVVQPYA